MGVNRLGDRGKTYPSLENAPINFTFPPSEVFTNEAIFPPFRKTVGTIWNAI